MLAADVRGGIREFMNNADGPAFLERELVGLGVDGYRQVRLRVRAYGTVPIHTFREHLTCFPMQKASHFLHWSWYIRLEDLQLARVVMG